MKNIVGCTDYDSMGNHGRFPKQKDKKMKRRLEKVFLWISYRFRKKRKNNIWEL